MAPRVPPPASLPPSADVFETSPILRALLEAGAAGIAVVDRERRYRFVSPSLAALSGVAPEAHLGRTVAEIIPHLEPVLEPLIARVCANGVPIRGQELMGLRSHVVVDVLPVRGDDAVVQGIAFVVFEITEKLRAEVDLAERLRFAESLSRLSTLFVELPSGEVDDAIAAGLEMVVRRLGVDRAYVGVFGEEAKPFLRVYQHCADGIAKTVDELLALSAEGTPWGKAQIVRGESVSCESIHSLPPEAARVRTFLEAGQVQSLAFVPLAVGGQARGFVCCETVRAPRAWSPEAMAWLRVIGELFAGGLERKRSDDALRDRLRFEETLTLVSASFVAAEADALDRAVERALGIVALAQGFDRAGVLSLDAAGTHLVLTHEWRAEGEASFREAMIGTPIREFGWPLPELLAGEPITLVRGALPESAVAAAQFLDRAGILCSVSVPLGLGGKAHGLVAFQMLHEETVPPPAMVGRLRLVGELIASALERKRAADEISRLNAMLERERDVLREELRSDPSLGHIVGGSPALRRALDVVDAVAGTTATVLVRGESGVGKELFARAIHERSARAQGPLVKVNCASIPESLFESEFFGHVRGAFTGAHKDRVGRFELADGGTLFLDEVGEIPRDSQAKLLRVLQEGELERVGDDRTRKVDVRVIAATNRDLEREVEEGRFRRDLYYRLGVFPIEVPPLRARREDILPLARHFLEAYAHVAARPGLSLSEEDCALLLRYEWPGNIRELQHVIERAVILSRTAPLQLGQAMPPGSQGPVSSVRGRAELLTSNDLREIERDNVLSALQKANWRISGYGGAADLLGIRPSTLRDRMKSLGVRRPA